MGIGIPITSMAIGFGLTVFLLWLLSPVAIRVGLLDSPGERKNHDVPTPLIGGLAMFLGFAFAALTAAVPLAELRGFFAASAMLIVVGVLDDLHELSAGARFFAQIIAALLMALWGGVMLHDLGRIVNDSLVLLHAWALPLTIVATVGVINALNMVDGLDGAAGCQSLIAILALTVLATAADKATPAVVLLLIAAVISAFLCFNLPLPRRKRAAVFMGDAGSMFLGFTLSWFVIDFSQGEQAAMTPVTALWILAVPLIDAVSVMLYRIIHGFSPFAPDRRHIHHLLLASGLSANQALVVLIGLNLILATIGLVGLFSGISETLLFYAFLGLFGLYFLLMILIWRRLLLPCRLRSRIN